MTVGSLQILTLLGTVKFSVVPNSILPSLLGIGQNSLKKNLKSSLEVKCFFMLFKKDLAMSRVLLPIKSLISGLFIIRNIVWASVIKLDLKCALAHNQSFLGDLSWAILFIKSL